MTRDALNKDDLLAAMAGHLLDHGLQTASLRPLAAAAQTSDRMLIYHFGSKDALIAAVLDHIAARLAEGLGAVFAGRSPMPAGTLLREVWQVAQTPAYRPPMRIWLELVGVAAREAGAKARIAHQIADSFLAWTAGHLTDPADAPLVLTCFEGMLVLQEAGHAATVDAALDRLCARLGT